MLNKLNFLKKLWLYELNLFEKYYEIKGWSKFETNLTKKLYTNYAQLIHLTMAYQLNYTQHIFLHKLNLLQHLLTLRPNLFLFNNKILLYFLKLKKIDIFNPFFLKNTIPRLKLISFIRKGRILFQYYTKFRWRQKSVSKLIQQQQQKAYIKQNQNFTLSELLFNTHFFNNYKIINFLIKNRYILLNNFIITTASYKLQIGDIIKINYSANLILTYKKSYLFFWRKKILHFKPITLSFLKRKKLKLLKHLKKKTIIKKHYNNIEIDYALNMICYIYFSDQFNLYSQFSSVIPYRTIKNLNWKYYF